MRHILEQIPSNGRNQPSTIALPSDKRLYYKPDGERRGTRPLLSLFEIWTGPVELTANSASPPVY